MAQILEFAPSYPPALVGLGSAQYMLSEHDAAFESWDRASNVLGDAQKGSLSLLHSNLGLSHYYAGRFDAAIQSHSLLGHRSR